MNKNKADEVNKAMTIAEILKAKPNAGEVLFSHGMHCLGCSIASGETLEQAAQVHGVSVDELITEINNG
jgi:hybrid cluster-associated redox disulfide protein